MWFKTNNRISLKKSVNYRFFYVFLLFSALIINGCSDNFTPKPRSYFRIALPEKKYQILNNNCDYTFEFPVYANIQNDSESNAEPCWINLVFPAFKAQIHLTYKTVNKDIDKLLEDSRSLAYKHTVKADAINEKLYTNDSLKIYGILYEIKGNAASSLQFCITDSTRHFLRGSLYFSVYPNKDSLAPVIDFFEQDIIHLMETCRWKTINN